MDEILTALGDPAIRGAYLAFCFALLVFPMIALALWYHRNIGKTAGGRALMRRQNSNPVRPRGSPANAIRQVQDASRFASEIASGKYGAEARSMQNRVYWIAALWVVANVLAFGILLWADEVNRSAG